MSVEPRRPARHELAGRGAPRALEPARGGPAQHELRRRQHLGQGHRRSTRSTGAPVELLWVKGSGGDLGTLTEAGLAVLRLDRLRALVDVYPGVEREDEMVAAFDYCLHGRGGAAPSIDTAMHGLVDAAHVDHLHPDSGIALATAADGEALTRRCFGDRVAWVAWRRPGLPARASTSRRSGATNPEAIGAILGGHGITAWGDTSDECEARSLEIIRTAERFIAEHGRPEPFGPPIAGLRAAARGRAPRPGRRAPAARPRPRLDRPAAGRPLHRQRGRPRLPRAGPSIRAWPRSGRRAPTTSCGRRSGRWSSTCRRRADSTTVVARLRELHEAYRDGLRAPTTSATRRRTARRCAAPTRRSSSCPGVGMFSFGANKQTARVAGEFYVNAINVMRGAEALSTLRADRRGGEVPDRVLGARGGQARADAGAEAARRAGRVRDRRAARGSARRSPIGSPPRAPASSSPTSTPAAPRPSPRELGGTGRRDQRRRRRHRRGPGRRRVPAGGARLRRRRPRRQQRRPVDLEAAARDDRCATGTSSTTSWPAARSSSRARRPGS